MYLERIKISNFRCFDSEGIEACFNKGVNSIVGENNTGKTALIDAIRIAMTTLRYQKEIYFRKSDFHIDLSGEKAHIAQFDLFFAEVPMLLYEIWMPESNNHGEFHIRFNLYKNAAGEEKIKYTAWGGCVEGNTLSPESLEAIDLSYLGALRDAEEGLRPSRNSRIAILLDSVVQSDEDRNGLVDILESANSKLLEQKPIQKIKEIINKNLDSIEQDVLSQRIDIGFTEPQFETITSSIRSWISMKWIRIDNTEAGTKELRELSKNPIYSTCIETHDDYILVNTPVFLQIALERQDCTEEIKQTLKKYSQSFELRQNGLGYNNLIYMSTILGDLSLEKGGIYHKMLLVEEPEAHLHPQLQELIYDFFQKQNNRNVQLIFTSHSPTLVSRIEIDQINLLFDKEHSIHCLPMTKCIAAHDASDKTHLHKYLDVTRSQLFFAKGLIFVEGISEALLVPEMAKALDRSLKKYAVEVINVDGLAFKPFVHLLYGGDDSSAFCKSVIITDDDRCIEKDENYISADIDYDYEGNIYTDIIEKLEKGNPSARYASIQSLCEETEIALCGAKKTFEYELAFSENNITVMLTAIKKILPQLADKLQCRIEECENIKEKQVIMWLFIRKRDRYKADLAQNICDLIAEGKTFDIPEYIQNAIYHVTNSSVEEAKDEFI